MKFRLDESLFDDEISFDEPSIKIFDEGQFASYAIDDIDDDLFYEPIVGANAPADHNGEVIPAGPKAGLDSGIADALIKLINDEWEAIQGYNDFRDMIMTMNSGLQ